jgi:hypothetical protein
MRSLSAGGGETVARTTALGLGVILIGLLVSACSIKPQLVVTPALGYYEIDGDVTAKAKSGSVGAGAKADADQLGLEEEVVPKLRADLVWEDWIVGLAGLYAGYEGDGEADAALSFRDIVIESGSKVDSEFTAWYLAAEGLYRILGPEDFVELAAGVAIGAVSYDLKIESKRVSAAKIDIDDVLPFGYLTGRVAKEFGDFRFEVRAAGVAASFDEEDVTFFEVDASATYRLWGELDGIGGAVQVGYQYIDFTYDWEPSGGKLEIDATLTGPFVGLRITF